MEKQSVFDKFREWVNSWAWGLFLWSVNMTQEQYWEEIYKQEKRHKEISVEIMTCGHEKRYIASTGEGTHFCVMCAFLAEHRINEKIRKVLAE